MTDIRPLPTYLVQRFHGWRATSYQENRAWYRRLAASGQHPRAMVISCCDSRVHVTSIFGADEGEFFIHRNIANLAPPQDANYLSVLQFAVDELKVKHVMVVGHYGCGGVRAAVDGRRRGLVDHWLHPIREVYWEHRAELEAIADEDARLRRLCELNVARQVRNVASDVFVLEAWARGQELAVHGWVYSLATGIVNDLHVSVSGPSDAPFG